MRVVAARSVWLQVLAWLGGFCLGPYSAFRISAATAPDSDIVQVMSVFGFALVFVVGTLLWMGLGIATVVIGALWSLVRGRLPGPGHVDPSKVLVPSGYRSYIVLGVLAGLAVGLFAGLLTDLPVSTAAGIWLPTGSGYGLLLWLAAHHGYLPFPEPE